jgi:hypothetical protein
MAMSKANDPLGGCFRPDLPVEAPHQSRLTASCFPLPSHRKPNQGVVDVLANLSKLIHDTCHRLFQSQLLQRRGSTVERLKVHTHVVRREHHAATARSIGSQHATPHNVGCAGQLSRYANAARRVVALDHGSRVVAEQRTGLSFRPSGYDLLALPESV